MITYRVESDERDGEGRKGNGRNKNRERDVERSEWTPIRVDRPNVANTVYILIGRMIHGIRGGIETRAAFESTFPRRGHRVRRCAADAG